MSSVKSPKPDSSGTPLSKYLTEITKTITQPLVPVLELVVGKDGNGGRIQDEDRPVIAIALILTIILGIVIAAPPDNSYVTLVLFIFLIAVTPLTWGKFLRDVRSRPSDTSKPSTADETRTPELTSQPQGNETSTITVHTMASGPDAVVERSGTTIEFSTNDKVDLNTRTEAFQGGHVTDSPTEIKSTASDKESDAE